MWCRSLTRCFSVFFLNQEHFSDFRNRSYRKENYKLLRYISCSDIWNNLDIKFSNDILIWSLQKVGASFSLSYFLIICRKFCQFKLIRFMFMAYYEQYCSGITDFYKFLFRLSSIQNKPYMRYIYLSNFVFLADPAWSPPNFQLTDGRTELNRFRNFRFLPNFLIIF